MSRTQTFFIYADINQVNIFTCRVPACKQWKYSAMVYIRYYLILMDISVSPVSGEWRLARWRYTEDSPVLIYYEIPVQRSSCGGYRGWHHFSIWLYAALWKPNDLVISKELCFKYTLFLSRHFKPSATFTPQMCNVNTRWQFTTGTNVFQMHIRPHRSSCSKKKQHGEDPSLRVDLSPEANTVPNNPGADPVNNGISALLLQSDIASSY
jgi:hypothetical protein